MGLPWMTQTRMVRMIKTGEISINPIDVNTRSNNLFEIGIPGGNMCTSLTVLMDGR
jgi:hypothetical protein